jgi:hypothetical protein
MFDQLFESLRRASESSMQMQQDLLKHWAQQWLVAQPSAAGASTEWGKNLKKRWSDVTLELLNKHRESLDAAYRSGIQLVEQTFRTTEAKSSDEYRRMVEDLWRKLFETLKDQSETQFRDFQRWSEKSADLAQSAQA